MATLGFLAFMTTIITIILIGLIIFGLRLYFKEKDDPRNEEWVLNLLSDYTGGYGLLLIKERESNKELIHITGSPRDIDYIKLKNKDFELKDQHLFVRKDLFIQVDNSAHRKINIAFPDKPEQIPNQMKNTFFGELVMQFIADRNAKKDKIDIQKIRENNMLKMTRKTEGLEMAQELSELGLDFVKETLKSKAIPEPIKEK